MITYRLYWKYHRSQEGLRWAIRGICDDGRLFGDIFFDSDDPLMNGWRLIETALEDPGREEFFTLAGTLPFYERMTAKENEVFAAIFKVQDGEFDHVFSYNLGDERTSDDAVTFLRIIELFRPYMMWEWTRPPRAWT